MIRIIVLGKVQSVGFRQFVRRAAQKQNLTGWVKNLVDGKVELVGVGPKQKIDFFVDIIKKGTVLSRIDDILIIERKNVSDNAFPSFKIIQTSK
jgi:acylphosphatase